MRRSGHRLRHQFNYTYLSPSQTASRPSLMSTAHDRTPQQGDGLPRLSALASPPSTLALHALYTGPLWNAKESPSRSTRNRTPSRGTPPHTHTTDTHTERMACSASPIYPSTSRSIKAHAMIHRSSKIMHGRPRGRPTRGASCRARCIAPRLSSRSRATSSPFYSACAAPVAAMPPASSSESREGSATRCR